MRDLFVICIMFFIFAAVLRKPFIGTAMWLWVAMFFPKGWVYGFASSIRYNFIVVILTILSVIFNKDNRQNQRIELDGLAIFILLFLFWTAITSFFNITVDKVVWADWFDFLKITLLFFFCIFIVTKALHINTLLWALVFSIGFLAALESLKYIASGGGHNIKGLSGHVLGDRNEFALSINMLIPLMYYLAHISKKKLIKIGLNCTIVLCVIAIIGTDSRGGLLALLVVAGYFWWQSKRKILYIVLFSAAIGIGSNFVPEEWTNRMNTIESATEDSSFLGRVLAWKTSILIANDHLFTGGGFKSTQHSLVWHSYQGYAHFNNIVDTSNMGNVGYKAAHSIYFQVLGDQGYLGFIMYLMILYLAFKKTGQVIARSKQTNERNDIELLCRMVRVSLVAYCVGGAAVSLAYFDMFYALLAVIWVVDKRLIKNTTKENIRY
ncbi:putative O-glycosylation ligase, exosortase A system-associated [Thalassotalea ganghwensis]